MTVFYKKETVNNDVKIMKFYWLPGSNLTEFDSILYGWKNNTKFY